MSKRMSKRSAFAILGLLAIALFASWLNLRPAPVGEAQVGLTDIHDVQALQAQFNQDEGKPRLILLISPT